MLTIVLMEPENSGNIGAIARSMKNFDLNNLILVNPKTNHVSEEAIKRAKHGKEILKNAKIIKNINYIFKNFNNIIGTTALVGTDYNIPRSPLAPDKIKINKKSAILFGRESSGLTNEEIRKCDYIVSIPTSKNYPTLNISHAATIIFYELFKNKENSLSKIELAGKKEKEELIKVINKKLNNLKFSTKDKRETQRRLWKRIIGKAYLTKREVFALFGFFKKIR